MHIVYNILECDYVKWVTHLPKYYMNENYNGVLESWTSDFLIINTALLSKSELQL